MNFFSKKCMAVALSLFMVIATLPASFADNVNTENENIGVTENYHNENNDDSGQQGMEIKLGVGKVTSDGQIIEQEPATMSAETKLDNNYAKTVSQVDFLYGSDRYQTSVKVSQEGWPNGSENLVIVNSNDTMVGLVATPFASLNKAPILITSANSLNSSVSNEIKRLKPKKVYIIGDRTVISKSVADTVKNITGASIERIFGKYPGELSAAVANRIASVKNVNTAYVVSATNGVADALSISSKAGETQNPVIVVDKTYINQDAYKFLNDKISTAYYIGGESSISSALIKKISAIVGNAGAGNRISGNDRHATNVNVINRFYKDANLPGIVITKSDNKGLIDTVSAGPFAAKVNAPIMITNKTSLTSTNKIFLDSRKTSTIFQIGGGISGTVTNAIKAKLQSATTAIPAPKPSTTTPKPSTTTPKPSTSTPTPSISNGIKGKTVVIDAGHGGSDPGAIGLKGVREKDWTLKTALACAEYLTQAGANVVMTRKTDIYPTLQDRADLSNNKNAVFFCSIHYNKGGDVVNESTGEQSGTGIEVFKGEGSDASNAASNVLYSILDKFNLRNRGTKDGTSLYVIANTNAPAILVEGGFVSNSKDVNALNSDAALKTMGIQIAKGIIATFDGKTIR